MRRIEVFARQLQRHVLFQTPRSCWRPSASLLIGTVIIASNVATALLVMGMLVYLPLLPTG